MLPEGFQRPPPRERTFAELFPWRNIRRAVMLVFLIIAIVVIKRSTGPLLARVGDMWGPPPAPSADRPPDQRPSSTAVHQIRLGPGLAPAPVPGTSPAHE